LWNTTTIIIVASALKPATNTVHERSTPTHIYILKKILVISLSSFTATNFPAFLALSPYFISRIAIYSKKTSCLVTPGMISLSLYIYVCVCVRVFGFFSLSHLCVKHGLGDACGGEGEKHAPSLVWLATL
jgi:hypothetical protein